MIIVKNVKRKVVSNRSGCSKAQDYIPNHKQEKFFKGFSFSCFGVYMRYKKKYTIIEEENKKYKKYMCFNCEDFDKECKKKINPRECAKKRLKHGISSQ